MILTIFELCKRMHEEQGYAYASLVGPDPFMRLANCQLMPGRPKPPHALFFTPHTNSPDDPKLWAPAWYDYVMYEDFRVEHYSMLDILFVRLHGPVLATDSNPRFDAGGDLYTPTDFIPVPNWPQVGREFSGIHVDPCRPHGRDGEIFGGWDVPTVCLWYSDAIREACLVKNAGTPFCYTF